MEAKAELEEMAQMVSLEEMVVMVPTLLKSLGDRMAQMEGMVGAEEMEETVAILS